MKEMNGMLVSKVSLRSSQQLVLKKISIFFKTHCLSRILFAFGISNAAQLEETEESSQLHVQTQRRLSLGYERSYTVKSKEKGNKFG